VLHRAPARDHKAKEKKGLLEGLLKGKPFSAASIVVK
jgi:hypothetical protein